MNIHFLKFVEKINLPKVETYETVAEAILGEEEEGGY